MARLEDYEYTRVSDRAIVGTGLASSPEGVAAYSDLQRAVFDDQPLDTQEARDSAYNAQQTANQANTKADSAQTSADSANTKAEAAQASANTAQNRADAAYDLADSAVQQDVGPSFAAPIAGPLRSALPAYIASDADAVYSEMQMQAVMDQVAALTARVAALIIDGRGNHSLTN